MFRFAESLLRCGHLGAGKMAQQVKALIIKTDGLSSVPRTHMVEKESRLYKLSFDRYTCTVTIHMHTIKKCNLKKKKKI